MSLFLTAEYPLGMAAILPTGWSTCCLSRLQGMEKIQAGKVQVPGMESKGDCILTAYQIQKQDEEGVRNFSVPSEQLLSACRRS